MENERVDRRVQRTRKLLIDSLMALIAEQSYESITVQDIIDRANLGRSTFYLHYQDKEDLMQSSIEGVVSNLIHGIENSSNIDKESWNPTHILLTLPIFRHAQEQHRFHKAMVRGRGVEILTTEIQRLLSGHIQEKINLLLSDGRVPAIPPPVLAKYLSGTLLTLLFWWLDNNMPYSPERMDEIFQELTMPGIRIALGLKLE